ncbi:hypothetical protein [Gracilimonas sp.]|uniref:hypothetical protein n=1 Tax=Gracilimonas sp. TaxID=1974203 RepID=UPI003D13A857
MKKFFLLTLTFLVISGSLLSAQPYMEKKSQHRFAQSYVGLNAQVTPSSGLMFWDGETHAFPLMTSPRISIGGLHFWGKVDFNLNIPLTTFADFKLDDETDFEFNPGGDLSARYYPWRSQFNKLRPYAGFSFNEMIFSLKNENAGTRRDLFITTSVLAGLAFASNGWQINAELMWLPNNKRTFYPDRMSPETFELPKSYFSVGLIRYFEGTLREEADLESGRMQRLVERFRKEGKLNSFSLAAAPSGSYFMLAPPLNDPMRRSLPRHKGTFVWDYGLGYLFHDAGLHIGVSYRDYTSAVESYGFEHLIRRRSLALEGFKFLGDYNGFVPFIGPSISLESWATGEFEEDIQQGKTIRKQMISPGIIFGWDILASPLETWVLRTNLRYYPFQKIKGTDGKTTRVDQFEFNFIQLVIYPNRLFNYPKVKGRI